MVRENMTFSLQTTEIKHNNSKDALVLLHGYGANRHDLAPLSEILRPKNKNGARPHYFFPEGPSAPIELAPFGGRAWFNLDMALLQRRALEPNGELYDEAHVEKLYKTSDTHLSKFMEELSADYDRIYLGGFSQGAMLALDFAWRHYFPKLKALVLYSPAWPYLKDPVECLLPKDFPVFVSHGLQDGILAIRHNEKLRNKLREQGAFLVESIFHGHHEIPMNVLHESEIFLDGLMKT
jgi:phospholipase/carboxylesterase